MRPWADAPIDEGLCVPIGTMSSGDRDKDLTTHSRFGIVQIAIESPLRSAHVEFALLTVFG